MTTATAPKFADIKVGDSLKSLDNLQALDLKMKAVARFRDSQ